MDLDDPLNALIRYCETLCLADCCGVQAFDFSPIHLASFLIRDTGKIERAQLAKISAQLGLLDQEARRQLAAGGMTSINVINQQFTAQELADLVATLRQALADARHLVGTVQRAAQAGRPLE